VWRPVRRLLPLLAAAVLAAPAAAATIHGDGRADVLLGTPKPDRILAGRGDDSVQVAWGGTDGVDCGPGRDRVTADLSDRLVGCEIVSRRLSVDPYANPDSQHETAVEPDSFSFGATVVAAFQLGRREQGAAANIGTAVSHDGGRTWHRAALPSVTGNSTPAGPEVAASDPTVAYDAAHQLWLVGTLTVEQGETHVYVARSSDGEHWSQPVAAASGRVLDKEWLVCDNGRSSRFHGRCYDELTDDDANVTLSSWSDDGGQTWSAPVTAGPILVGTQPVVRPDGTLVVVAGDYEGAAALTGSIVALRSTDGGATFARTVVSDLHAAPGIGLRSVPLASVDVDSDGTIYAAWHDCRFRPGCAANDVVLATSPDGATWSAPQRVPLVPAASTASTFIPGLAADPAEPGHLALLAYEYLPGSCQRGECLLGTLVTTSTDGGRSWAPAQRLDAQPVPLSWLARSEGGRMLGDYVSISFASGRLVPVFVLAAPPLGDRLREGVFAASLPG
jgi:hypothetical protein